MGINKVYIIISVLVTVQYEAQESPVGFFFFFTNFINFYSVYSFYKVKICCTDLYISV